MTIIPSSHGNDKPRALTFPSELTAYPQWVVWRMETRQGKQTKVPYNPARGSRAKANDPSTWSTYDQAVAAYRGGDYAGVGFVVTKSDPFIGVDLDHCLDRQTGELQAWAKDIIEKLDSYTEITPSGEGVRVWVRGALSGTQRRKGRFEVYSESRYFTLTGQHFAGPLTIEERSAALAEVCRRIFDAPDPAPAVAPPPAPSAPKRAPRGKAPAEMTDDELLAKASSARNGARFRELYYTTALSGDASGHDLALCNLLAFWTDKDVSRIDRLFRASARMRPKWDEKHAADGATYGALTIRRAVEQCAETYRGPRPARAAAAPPPAPPATSTPAPSDTPNIDDTLHDTGNARRLIARHGMNLKYNNTRKSWFVWDGRRWALDENGEAVRLAVDTIDHIHEEAGALARLDQAERLIQFARRSHAAARIAATLEIAQSIDKTKSIISKQLDVDPWLLNVHNGTLNLRTGELYPHRREDLITRMIPVDYHPNEKADAWEYFLWQTFGGNMPLVGFMRRAVGYALTGCTSEHALFFLHGTGANGKSTFLNVISTLLGEYAWQANPLMLMARRDGEMPNGIANLDGKRFVTANEIENGRQFSTSVVKILTSEDPINARRLYENEFTFIPTHKVFLAGNHEPVIRDSDLAIWRRLKKIPFLQTVPPEKQDHHLAEKLTTELPGILAWAVRGCREWQENGLQTPAEVEAATSAYRSGMDILGRFIEDTCNVGKECQAKAGLLYSAFRDWCDRNGERHFLSGIAFGRSLTDRGYAAVKMGGIQYRRGLSLIGTGEEQQQTIREWA